METGYRWKSSASFAYSDIMPDEGERKLPEFGDYKPNLLTLVPDTDPILKTPLEDFDFTNLPTDPLHLSFDLIYTMAYNNGLGLSANQCGLPYRVFVIRHEQHMVCFNPKIVAYGDSELEMMEGCLSFPTLAIPLKRPSSVRVRFQTPDGQTHTHTFTGMTARVFQHEFDHMEGETFLDRLSPLKKDSAMRKYSKSKRQRKLLQELAA